MLSLLFSILLDDILLLNYKHLSLFCDVKINFTLHLSFAPSNTVARGIISSALTTSHLSDGLRKIAHDYSILSRAYRRIA